jgi:hypothetical protein
LLPLFAFFLEPLLKEFVDERPSIDLWPPPTFIGVFAARQQAPFSVSVLLRLDIAEIFPNQLIAVSIRWISNNFSGCAKVDKVAIAPAGYAVVAIMRGMPGRQI